MFEDICAGAERQKCAPVLPSLHSLLSRRSFRLPFIQIQHKLCINRRSVEIEHAWVITVGSSTATANPATTGKNSAASPRVCGWDPTTGHTDGCVEKSATISHVLSRLKSSLYLHALTILFNQIEQVQRILPQVANRVMPHHFWL
jgi:hypothetical protein